MPYYTHQHKPGQWIKRKSEKTFGALENKLLGLPEKTKWLMSKKHWCPQVVSGKGVVNQSWFGIKIRH